LDLIGRIQNLLKREIRINPGERLLLTLSGGRGGEFRLERTVYAEQVEMNKPRQKKTGVFTAGGRWLAAVLQNKITEEEAKLTQLITVEDVAESTPRKGTILQHLYPGFTWLELSGHDGKPAQGLRWHHEYRYPAPAFRINAGTFRPGDESKAKLWFSDSALPLEPAARSVPMDDVKPGQEMKLQDGAWFVIEKMEPQDRYVTVADGVREEKKCLVVYARYDPARPVWIQAVGAGSRGEEHHFYTKGGKYVAIFWGGANPSRLNVVSVNEFKRQARPLEWALPHPDPRDTGPSIEKLGG
jgi:hypothetical protein